MNELKKALKQIEKEKKESIRKDKKKFALMIKEHQKKINEIRQKILELKKLCNCEKYTISECLSFNLKIKDLKKSLDSETKKRNDIIEIKRTYEYEINL